MVHALKEIRRILVCEGFVIDLRPLADHWPVEITLDGKSHVVGRLHDLPAGLVDDEAANFAIKEAAKKGWFVREREMIFPFYYYWESPVEMQEYISDKWADFIELGEDVMKAAESAWKSTYANSSVRVKMKMSMTNWRKR